MKYFLHVVTMLAMAFSSTVAAQQTQPNIILILVDDLGWGDLNVRSIPKQADTPRIKTPKLSQMAERGLVLRRHYTAAPVCAPARASLFSGVHQGQTEVIRNNNFDAALENSHTLASVLKSAGYATAIIGKWGIGGGNESGGTPDTAAAWPTKRGFDFFFGMHNHLVGHRHYPKEESNADPDTHCNAIWENGKVITQDLDGCYTTDLFTARAKKWIVDHRKAHAQQPFFLALTLTAPHARLGIPSMPYPQGGGLKGGIQWLGKPGNMINTAKGEWDSYINPEYRNNATWQRYAKKRYGNNAKNVLSTAQRHAAMVHRIDDAVGDILHLCRDLNIDQNTCIVFTSDNGPHTEPGAVGSIPNHPAPAQNPSFFRSYGPFDGVKRDTFDGGLRVPCLVYGPGIVNEGVSNFPCQFHDWMATFADLAGVARPMRSTGVSLLPLLKGKETKQQDGVVYTEYNFGGNLQFYPDFANNKRNRARGEQQAFYFRHSDGRHLKAIRTNIKTGHENFEIYDTLKDPAESTNIAASLPASVQDSLRAMALHNRRAFGYRHDSTAGRRHNGISGARCYDAILIPADAPASTEPGLAMRRLTATCDWVPEFSSLPGANKAETGIVADPTAIELPAGTITELTGYIDIPSDGNHWHFFLTLSDVPGSKAFFRMHNFPLVDADKNYKPGTTAVSTTVPNVEEMPAAAIAQQTERGLPLKAGKHKITLTIVQGPKAPGKLSLGWKKGHKPAEVPTKDIPASAFSH